VKVGRIAGQFAKPRTSPNGEGGTARNCQATAATSSTASSLTRRRVGPDPERQIEAFRHSAATLNLLRAFVHGGYANLGQCPAVDARLRQGSRRSRIIMRSSPTASARRSASCKLRPRSRKPPRAQEHEFYTSHEALLLGYEQAMTREDSTHPGTFCCTSAHMLWIGDRTRQPDHAHVEFCRGIMNPLGLKCGPLEQGRRTAAPD